MQPSKTYGCKSASVDITVRQSTCCTGCFCHTVLVVPVFLTQVCVVFCMCSVWLTATTLHQQHEQTFHIIILYIKTCSILIETVLMLHMSHTGWLRTLSQLWFWHWFYNIFQCCCRLLYYLFHIKMTSGCLFSMLSHMGVSLVFVNIINVEYNS